MKSLTIKNFRIKLLSVSLILLLLASFNSFAKEALTDEEKEAQRLEKEAQKAERDAQKAEEKAKRDAQKQAEKDAINKAKENAKAQRLERKEQIGEQVKKNEDGSVSFTALNGNTMNFPKVAIIMEQGISMTNVTRIIDQHGERNNYVFKDSLAGAYLVTKTRGLGVAEPMARLAAYIPLSSTFNSVPQGSFDLLANVTKPALDGFLGLEFRLSFLDYLFMDIQPGLHMFYQTTERFNYLDMGLEGRIAFELPIAYEWTIVLAGNATWDFGNAGTNKNIETYNYIWQMGWDLGFRYTTKAPNKYNYLNQTEELIQVKKDIKNSKKQAKKAIADQKRAEAKAKQAEKNAEKEKQKAEANALKELQKQAKEQEKAALKMQKEAAKQSQE